MGFLRLDRIIPCFQDGFKLTFETYWKKLYYPDTGLQTLETLTYAYRYYPLGQFLHIPAHVLMRCSYRIKASGSLYSRPASFGIPYGIGLCFPPGSAGPNEPTQFVFPHTRKLYLPHIRQTAFSC